MELTAAACWASGLPVVPEDCATVLGKALLCVTWGPLRLLFMIDVFVLAEELGYRTSGVVLEGIASRTCEETIPSNGPLVLIVAGSWCK